MSRVLILLSAMLILVLVSVCSGQEAAKPQGSGDKFAAQAADVIDNTLLSVKNGINSMFEDGSKLGSFFANVTSHFKKLTGQDKEPSAS